MDGLAIHPYGDNSSQPPSTGHPNSHDHRDGRLRQARLAPRAGVRRHGAARFRASDPLRRVRRGVADPGRQGEPLHRQRASGDATRRRVDAGGVLRAGARPRLLPADGRGHADLPLPRRARASRLAVRSALRGRNGEGEPVPGHGSARPNDGRLDRALPRRPAHRPPDFPPVRHAVRREARRVPAEPPLQPRLLVRARVERASTHSTKLEKRGRLEVGELAQIDLGTRRLAPGPYRYTLRLVHPVNPGHPTRFPSRPFTLP